MRKQITYDNIRLGKLVHGGQCLAEAPDGRKLFVWGGLPGELVSVRITKKKSSYLEGVVSELTESAESRIEPEEPDVYLSSSPWQIMKFEDENQAKQTILTESFKREGVSGVSWQEFHAGEQQFGYRNKIELGFWGDDDGLHYACYIRGTHGKRIITKNKLACTSINDTLPRFLDSLRNFTDKKQLRAGDLKTVIFRASASGSVAAALFMKQEIDCTNFQPPAGLDGLVIYYSNPKSPASVPTKQLYLTGDITLTDDILGKNIIYDVLSFFQVNLPVFEKAASDMSRFIDAVAVDFYSGVGTIGVPVGATTLVESDEQNVAMARLNAAASGAEVVHAASEAATDYIPTEGVLIVDPPRAGLHADMTQAILDKKPSKILYLSCNPSTQARDVALLHDVYSISFARGYNFFPRTPHIESLVVLELKP